MSARNRDRRSRGRRGSRLPGILFATATAALVGLALAPRGAFFTPATPVPTPVPLPILNAPVAGIVAKEVRSYASFVTSRQALQVPLGAIRPLPPGASARDALSGLARDQGAMLVANQLRTAPLSAGDLVDEAVVAYVGPDDAVVEVRRLGAGASDDRPVAPYRLAVVAPAALPGLDRLVGGERFVPVNVGPSDEPLPVRSPTIPIPPAGTALAYPPPTGATPTPRPTVSGAYPAP